MDNYHKTVVFDVETTGLIPHRVVPGKRAGTTRKEQYSYETDFLDFPRIVSFAWKIDDEPAKEYIINQEGREIPKEASDIHGITTKMANDSPFTFDQVINDFIREAFGCEIVVGFNIYFDSSIIKANVLREYKDKTWRDGIFSTVSDILHKDKRIDVMRCAQKMCGGWPKLEDLYFLLFQDTFKAHSAVADTEATSRVYLELVKMGFVPTFEQMQEKIKKD